MAWGESKACDDSNIFASQLRMKKMLANMQVESILNMSVNDNEETESVNFLNSSRKINIYMTSIIIIVGLVGNFLTIFVFSQKRFRHNSSHVYLLSLAINDSLFLIIHFFEDTIRTYKDVYWEYMPTSNQLINALNITDHLEITCRLINYSRNVLRFNSAYIVVSFSIQRLSIVYKPLSLRFKTKQSAWNTVLAISLVAFLINSWVPFLFHIQEKEDLGKYCDINKYYKRAYFRLNTIYTALIMSLPMVVILLCNCLIIRKTVKDDSKRSRMHKPSRTEYKVPISHTKNKLTISNSTKMKTKPYYLTFNQIINKQTKSSTYYSKKITIILLFISFSLVILNLPYLVTW